MPTWRAYLAVASYSRDGGHEARQAARDRFLASGYREFMVRFLNDPGLLAALERYDYTLEFLPHYEMRAMVGEMVPDRDRVRIVDQDEVGVQEAMRRCDLFVTDWSSTAFDVAYLGTPWSTPSSMPRSTGTGTTRRATSMPAGTDSGRSAKRSSRSWTRWSATCGRGASGSPDTCCEWRSSSSTGTSGTA
ncbi:CDP-glycerol glycerophosphotransferase family protein [Streptomyces sp. DHE7-1]|nr:CDP-glycerol glycerophosphotransferase family protein [Streptomyces sp. DHE7-1]